MCIYTYIHTYTVIRSLPRMSCSGCNSVCAHIKDATTHPAWNCTRQVCVYAHIYVCIYACSYLT